MIKMLRAVSRSFKQARISGGRVIIATAEDSRLLNSLDTGIIIGNCVQSQCGRITYVSKDLNSETPGRPYEVVFSFKVFSNKGILEISSTSR